MHAETKKADELPSLFLKHDNIPNKQTKKTSGNDNFKGKTSIRLFCFDTAWKLEVDEMVQGSTIFEEHNSVIDMSKEDFFSKNLSKKKTNVPFGEI